MRNEADRIRPGPDVLPAVGFRANAFFHALETELLVVFHRGGDNPYDGSMDQEIQAMTFRLEVEE